MGSPLKYLSGFAGIMSGKGFHTVYMEFIPAQPKARKAAVNQQLQCIILPIWSQLLVGCAVTLNLTSKESKIVIMEGELQKLR